MNKMEELNNHIRHLQESRCSGVRINAELFNNVNKILGCEDNIVENETVPGGGSGSNLFLALMYQNLLLARQVEQLERRVELINHPTSYWS